MGAGDSWAGPFPPCTVWLAAGTAVTLVCELTSVWRCAQCAVQCSPGHPHPHPHTLSSSTSTPMASAAGSSLVSRFRSLVATQPRIILGTASSSRRFVMDQLCKEHSFSYEVLKADIDEKAIRHEQPQQLVLALAHAKADAIIQALQQQQQQETGSSSSNGAGLLITCDQVVVHDGQIREKPEDVQEAHK